MHQYGLKLWSINDNYVAEALRLFNEGVYQYIELYVKPGSYEKYIDMWQKLPIPYVIHAPHFRDGVNLAKKEQEAKNRELIGEAQRFADRLKADKLIVHPGIEGDIKETAKQLKQIADKRILVENNPYHALDDGLICNGATPEEIGLVMEEANVGFCLDVGHAICSANALKQRHKLFFSKFLALKPAMFHLTDGDGKGVLDSHVHIGKGTYDLSVLLKTIPDGTLVTVETDKDSVGDLADYERDVQRLREYE